MFKKEDIKPHPMTIHEFITMKYHSSPKISPDGKTVAFVVREVFKEENKTTTNIWLVNVDGTNLRKLTNVGDANYSPAWSPDGSKIVFVSTRGESGQVWEINVNGGEAKQLTNLSTSVGGVRYSPDGKSIIFHSNVYKDALNDEQNKKLKEKIDNSKVKARIIDHLLFRHWNTWKDGKRNHIFTMTLDTEKLKDLFAGKDFDSPTFPFGGSGDYDVSPDSKELCYTAKKVKPETLTTNTDLFIIDLKTFKEKKITTNKGADGHPVYSPDGKYIAFHSQEKEGYESDKWRLMLYNRETGKIKEIAKDFDDWIKEFVWSPDSKKIYFNSVVHARQKLYSYDITSDKVMEIDGNNYNYQLNISPDGKYLVYVKRSFNFPPTIYTLDTATNVATKIADFNDETLSNIIMEKLEDVWYKGAKGDKIHALLIKPPDFDANKKYPAMVICHGGPQSAFVDAWYSNWNIQTFASKGYVIFIPNFHGSNGYGQEFVDSINKNWGGDPYIDVMKGYDYLIKLPYVDKKRVGAAGASFGGYMVNWIQANTDKFNVLVSFAGAFNLISKYGVTEELWFPEWDFGGTPYDNPDLYMKYSPSTYVNNFKTPCLVVHGELDYRVPVGEGFQTFTALQRKGIPSKLLYYPDEGHWLSKPLNNELWYKTYFEWIEKYLK